MRSDAHCPICGAMFVTCKHGIASAMIALIEAHDEKRCNVYKKCEGCDVDNAGLLTEEDSGV